MENRQSAADFFDKIAVNGGRYVFFEKRSLQRPGKTAGAGAENVFGDGAGVKRRQRVFMLFKFGIKAAVSGLPNGAVFVVQKERERRLAQFRFFALKRQRTERKVAVGQRFKRIVRRLSNASCAVCPDCDESDRMRSSALVGACGRVRRILLRTMANGCSRFSASSCGH